MDSHRVECVVIGAGVIGLAIARALALDGRDVWLLEQEKNFGRGISSRNSEVIHAGIYYPEDSLKARLCVEGKTRLYAYAAERHIPYRQCGKMIVAQDALQQKELEAIQKKAVASGVNDLRFLSRTEIKKAEPALNGSCALYSPSTGIIDTHTYMLHLLGDFQNAGGQCVLGACVMEGRAGQEDGLTLIVQNGEECLGLHARYVINAAGLNAVSLAHKIEPLVKAYIPPQFYAKGHYFALQAKNPFSHLIYPVPDQDGLGIHLTFDISGKAKFGPDVEWITDINYKVHQARDILFYPVIRKYWPGLPDGSLVADYAGIRPKIYAPGEPVADFIIEGQYGHGVQGLVNLFGIESPGLTASLAIAEHVKKQL